MSWKKMMFIVLSTSLLLLGFVMALNYFVNPLGKYASRELPSLVWTGRADKANLLQKYNNNPDVLVLGSSRTMKINPNYIEEKTDLNAFNAGVNSARAEDYYVMLKYALEDLDVKPEYVILGIDLEGFHNNAPLDDRLIYNQRFARYLHPEDRENKLSMLKSLISYDQTVATGRSLSFAMTEYPTKKAAYDNDGYLHYPKKEKQIKEGKFKADIDSYIKKYKGRFNNFTAIDEGRKDYLNDFLTLAEENDIQVIGFITTLHDDVLAELRKTRDYDERKAELTDFLNKMKQEHTNFTYNDFDEVKKYAGYEEAFYDGAHIREENADKITTRLLQEAKLTKTVHADEKEKQS
ncbi:hypothetical protein [Pseudalkalibacillus caeni]|uniref:SGNH/GDSL hydrolase family protein n=1 Tax=Exobacillus caeni TaxID=2574798 RepID=A0A5R9F0Y9_9BACL|nr:hypothetical protein [Pseudalkalibacillus caeni]TLS36661.1 hypothetical protein FCL54_14160 [Pseudalkalibacillus caeni]